MDQEQPLKRFDYEMVGPKFKGLFFNINNDLDKRGGEADARGDSDAARCLSLLNLMFRFAWNSYEAVLYLTGDIPEDPRRKPNYVIVVPNINRQLLDLLFTLTYMVEDLRARSLDYQRAGYRDLREEITTFKDHFGDDPEWKLYFDKTASMLVEMEKMYKITPAEKANLALIDFWPTPFKLLKRAKTQTMSCASFLVYLEKWLYKETSAQSHLTFAGIFKVAPFIVAPALGKEYVAKVQDRPMKVFHFQQVTRTALSFLAIATEIDTHGGLGNRDSINYLWVILGEYVAEAKEMWEQRYRDRPL
jgi:hypothetical protein